MSDTQNNDTLSFLKSELSAARQEAAKYRNIAKKAKGEVEQLRSTHQSEVDKLTAKRDEYKKALDAKPDPESELSQLKLQLKQRDARDAFKSLYEDAEVGLNGKVPVEKLWKLIDFDPAKDLDLGTIKGQLAGLKESDPYLFQAQVANPSSPGGTPTQPAAAQVAPQPGPGLRRGSPDPTQGFFTYRTSDTQDPNWMRANQSALFSAMKDGRARRAD